jgi:hypothetical protein
MDKPDKNTERKEFDKYVHVRRRRIMLITPAQTKCSPGYKGASIYLNCVVVQPASGLIRRDLPRPPGCSSFAPRLSKLYAYGVVRNAPNHLASDIAVRLRFFCIHDLKSHHLHNRRSSTCGFRSMASDLRLRESSLQAYKIMK